MLLQSDALEILIVDDDRQLLRTLSDILRLRGYVPVTAGSGSEGVRVARTLHHPPLVALIDLRLPDCDGVEVIHDLRALSDRTEFVVLTGNATVDSAVRALREQSFDYLTKPVRPEDLFLTVEKATERRHRKDAEAALRESEERLRRLFGAIADGVVVTDEKGVIITANPAMCALAGVPLDDLLQRPLDSLLRAEARTPGPPDGGVYRLARRGGDARVVEARRSSFGTEGRVHILRDVTEQRKLEAQLRQSQKMDAIGRLAGGVAHDFNNILTAILASADMLVTDTKEEDSRQYGEEILGAARRAAALTRQLLSFARQEAMKPAVVDPFAKVTELAAMLRRLMPANVEFRSELDGPVPLIRVDPAQFEQVVMNLAVNARDAMPRGGVLTVTVASAQLDEDRARVLSPDAHAGAYAVLTVRDTGTGIPAALLSQIFEPFFTTKELGQGTGLGLATVLSVVQRMDGFVNVESEEGVGTAIHVYIPLAGEGSVQPPPQPT